MRDRISARMVSVMVFSGATLCVLILLAPLAASPVVAQQATTSMRVYLQNEVESLESLYFVELYDSAIIRADRALSKARDSFGDLDTSVARLLYILGECHFQNGEAGSAESLYSAAQKVTRQVLNEDDLLHLDVSARLHGINWRWVDAESLHVRALVIREELLGSKHPHVANNLNSLGYAYCRNGKDDEAEPLFRRALAIYEAVYGPDHPAVGQTLHLLANTLAFMRRYDESLKLQLRANAIWERFRGPEHISLRRGIDRLGVIYMNMARFDESETAIRRALAINMRLLGSEHPETLSQFFNLGRLCWILRKFNKAEEYFKKVLHTKETVLRQDEAELFFPLIWLYAVYLNQGDRILDAKAVAERALTIVQKLYNPNHWRIAQQHTRLVEVEFLLGNYRAAEMSANRALEIINKSSHWRATLEKGRLLRSMAELESAKGNYIEAIEYWRQNRHISMTHPFESEYYVDGCFSQDFAEMFQKAKMYDSSLYYYSLGTAGHLMMFKSVFPFLAETQKLKEVRRHSVPYFGMLTMVSAHSSRAAKATALKAILSGKGLILDAISADREVAYCEGDQGVHVLLENHNDVGEEMAMMMLGRSVNLAPDELRERFVGLSRLRDSIEVELSIRCDEFGEHLSGDMVEVADIAGRIPAGAVLWEIVRYKKSERFWDASASQESGADRYLGFQLSGDGTIAMEDLGDARVVDSLINKFRQQIHGAADAIYGGLEDSVESALSSVTSKLYNMVFAPMKEHLASEDQIVISPDGQLSLLPFDALMGPSGKYVIEDYQISYVSSGRDLLKYTSEIGRNDHLAVIVTDPDFNSDSEGFEPAYHASVLPGEFETQGLVTRGPTDRSHCLDQPFKRLFATRSEGEFIASLLSGHKGWSVKSYSGALASESQLKSIADPPRVLHLATHGYYCSKARFSGDAKLHENPLLYSGLAMAGANRVVRGEFDYNSIQTSQQDGILTSLEASGLNLIGTELVVLSACQTGVGVIENGEGVYGLRRAFQLAGARSIIMSMFAVPDKATQTLMIRFYTNWLEGQSKASALRQAALSIIRERRANGGAAHPLFWGGFVLVGDPN